MPSDIYLRSFQPADFVPLVALWNICLTRDPIIEGRFWRQFLLDPNFNMLGARVACTTEGTIVGFLQTIVRREPYGSVGLQNEQGWITAFFVHPDFRRQGIGTRLLEEGLAFLRKHGRRRVSCNGYAPYYLFPGVDVEYSEAQAFLQARGFVPTTEGVAMGMPLEGVRMPEQVREKRDALASAGFLVRPFQREDTLPLLDFVEQHFAHWAPSLRDGLLHGNEKIMIATLSGEVVAYTQWENPHNDPPEGAPGRFGPFGVRPDLRSQGIGAVVFWTLVERAAGNGGRYLWFGWAGGRNLSFYERAGCRVTRRFQLYGKTL